MNRLEQIEAKLKARAGKKGFKDNTAMLEREAERMRRESV